MTFEHVRSGQRWRPNEFELNAIIDAGREYAGAQGVTPPGSRAGIPIQPVVVRVRNSTGGAAARYRAFAIEDSMWELSPNSNLVECVFNLEIWSSGKSVAVIQQPLADGAIGLAVISGPTLIECANSGSTSALLAEPNSSGLAVPGSGPITLTQPRPSAGGVVLSILGAGGSDAALFKTPDAGIPAATGNGPYTFFAALCAKVGVDGAVSTDTDQVYNSVGGAIPGGRLIQAKRIDGKWFVDVVDCNLDDDDDATVPPGPDPEPPIDINI
jgi:hypothetical protein